MHAILAGAVEEVLGTVGRLHRDTQCVAKRVEALGPEQYEVRGSMIWALPCKTDEKSAVLWTCASDHRVHSEQSEHRTYNGTSIPIVDGKFKGFQEPSEVI